MLVHSAKSANYIMHESCATFASLERKSWPGESINQIQIKTFNEIVLKRPDLLKILAFVLLALVIPLMLYLKTTGQLRSESMEYKRNSLLALLQNPYMLKKVLQCIG